MADLEDAPRERPWLDLALDLRMKMTRTLVLGGSIGEVPQDWSSIKWTDMPRSRTGSDDVRQTLLALPLVTFWIT